MTGKEFLNHIAHSKDDFLQVFFNILKKNRIPFCVIGGLAVNAYAEPVVSLDLDIVVVLEKLEFLISSLKRKKYIVKSFPNSINISSPKSDLRIQIQTDKRYLPFIRNAVSRKILGYDMQIARIEDLFQGKIWAAEDEKRRPSKRQKDLADILRLIEKKKSLRSLLPPNLKKLLFEAK